MTVPETIELVVTALGGGALLGSLGTWLWKGGSKWRDLSNKLTGIENEVKRVADEIHELRGDRRLLDTTVSRVDAHQQWLERLDRLAP